MRVERVSDPGEPLTPAPDSPPPALDVRGLRVVFGGVVAVDHVSFRAAPGELVGLIGPNGAGKTTCIDAMCGFVPAGGQVLLDGADLSGLPPHARARAGLGRTWQSVELFEDLTVAQNCEVAGADPARRAEVLDLLGLTPVAHRTPRELSHGRQKLAGLARALAGRPRVVLLDEPAAGLDPEESQGFGAHLRALTDSGTTVILVDHDTELVFTACDRVVVLEFGSVIADGPPDLVRSDRRVIEAYLGSPHEAVAG